MAEKIRIVLLAGFLGSGKTTVLNELIRSFGHVKLGMLVNDFGEVPVDGSLLKEAHPDLLEGGHRIYEIGNGSIFCSCLKAPFLFGLRYFQREKPEILFIEASGLSDPSSMDRILREHGLEDSFEVRQVVTLADPLRFTPLMHVLEVVRRQVESADQVLVGKADLAGPGQMAETLRQIRLLNPSAPVQTGSFGRFDYRFLEEASRTLREEERESCNTPETRPASLHLEGPVRDRESLLSFLNEAEPEIYRLKGFLDLEGGLTYVSDTGRGFSLTPVSVRGGGSGLTLLCPPGKAGFLADLWEKARIPGIPA